MKTTSQVFTADTTQNSRLDANVSQIMDKSLLDLSALNI